MINILSRIASAGARQLSQLSSMITTQQLPTLQTTLLQPLSFANTSIVNTAVPSRGKKFEHHFLNKWMARDYKRRVMLKEYYPLRQRYVAIMRCSVLPKELQEVAAEELHTFPRDSNFTRTKKRCIYTSRPRWVIHRFRASRIMWRHFADYNKISGVLRATW